VTDRGARGIATKRAHDAASARRLAHEVTALERCRGIASVSEIVAYDGASGELSTRWIEGRALDASAWRMCANTERRAIALALLDTLEAIHARGIVHRDLKPANVILSLGARVTVIDFDHALVDGDGPSGGTRRHAAPELFYLPSSQLVDYRADHFALALLIRGLLFDLPYQFDDTTRWQALVNQAPWPERDDPLLAAIERHLAPWRDDRPGTLDEVRALIAEMGERAEPSRREDGPRVAAPDAGVWQALASELPEGLCSQVERNLASLSPHLARGAPAHPLRLGRAELTSLVDRLARRQAYIAAGRCADAFAVAHLGLACGLLRETLAWSREHGGPEAALIEAIAANSLGAHTEAERRLAALTHARGTSIQDATIQAVVAESLAARGRASEARAHVRMAYLFPRAKTVEGRARFWSAIAATYLAQMDIAGLATVLETVPREELHTASLVVLESAGEHATHLLARHARCRHRHPAHRALFEFVAHRGLVDLHHLLVELALIHWPGGRLDTTHVVDVVERAAGVLAILTPETPFGPLVRAASLARLGRFAEARELTRATQASFTRFGAVLDDLAPAGAELDADWYDLVAGWSLGIEPLRRRVARRFDAVSGGSIGRALDALFKPELRRMLDPSGGDEAERTGVNKQILERELADQERILEGLEDDAARQHLRMLADLLDAMRLHGHPHSALRYLRARFLALRRDHDGVIARVAEAHVHGDRDWRLWLLAVPAYLSLGRRIDARMALSHLKELAPEQVAIESAVAEFERYVAHGGD